MDAEKILAFLRNLTMQPFEKELSFLATALPEFITILGYDKSHLFFETAFGNNLENRADAIISTGRTKRPWILFETKVQRKGTTLYHNSKYLTEGKKQLQKYATYLDPQYSVLFSPSTTIILENGNEFIYSHFSLDINSATELYRKLKCPETFPDTVNKSTVQKVTHQSRNKYMDVFFIDTILYSNKLDNVVKAKTNDEKKKTLEELAKFLFECVSFLKCKYRNLNTASSEIDIVIQYKGFDKPTLFDDYGRYFLVECKNWKSSVGAPQVRDFLGKLQKTKVKLGIIFARNGISGAHSGADALREIHSAFDRFDISLLVISEEDLVAVKEGANFYDILEEKADKLRFDI